MRSLLLVLLLSLATVACTTGRINLRDGTAEARISQCEDATFDIVVDQESPDINFAATARASGGVVRFSNDLVKRLNPRSPVRITLIVRTPGQSECPLNALRYVAELPGLTQAPDDPDTYEIDFDDFRAR